MRLSFRGRRLPGWLMSNFHCPHCDDGSCQRCDIRRHAQDLILNGPPANHVFTNVEFDALLNEPIEQQIEAEITGRCSHGCNPELIIKSDFEGIRICKLTRRPCAAQQLAGIVSMYSKINAKPARITKQ